MKFKEKLRYKYPLTKDSVVLDVGGYKGTFAAEIVRRYGCHVYVFEPVFDITPTENISIYKYGLWHCDTESTIYLGKDGTSIIRKTEEERTVTLRDIYGVWKELNLGIVDLVKLNVEGAEYAILDRMFTKCLIPKCKYLQIQFHDDLPFSFIYKQVLTKRLNYSHELQWEYPWIWESWKKR